ncbi:MAG: ATP-binding protein [Campylobacterota bacterium]|nr:ATP-binding protein [Campylobacterota bacterium]
MEESSKLKILVCEANLRVLNRLESWIEAMGEEVIGISDGIKALEIFKYELPDILLISQELKSMGGIELVEEVKKIAPNQAVVMMISESDTIFKRAIDLQVDKYLNVPVEAAPLFHSIESLAQEKLWHQEFKTQKKVLQDYKDAIDLSFSVSRHNNKGDVIYVNDLFCTTTGIRHSDVMQGVLNPLNNPNADMEVVWDALKTDMIYRDRQIFKLEDSSERIIDVTAVALMNETDTVYEYLVFTDDVTEIIHTARKVKNQELDSRLEKINHAKELSRVEDSFLTIFTHELKTPLNSIINFSEYVVKHLVKEEFAKKERLLSQVQEINSSGHFMLHMITNLMEAMKLKDSIVELNVVEIDISNTIRSMLQTKFNHVENIDVTGNFDVALMIQSDASRISQIVEHLLSNALKYASSKVKVTVNGAEEEFAFIIEDDGSGFSNTENVFNLFEQADLNSLTREAVGVGTGLFIVKQLCDRMAYKIELSKSEKLGGAKVILQGPKDIR